MNDIRPYDEKAINLEHFAASMETDLSVFDDTHARQSIRSNQPPMSDYGTLSMKTRASSLQINNSSNFIASADFNASALDSEAGTSHARTDSGFLSSSSSSIEELVTTKRGTAELTRFLLAQLKRKRKVDTSRELRKFFEVLFQQEKHSANGPRTSFGIFDSKLRLFLKSVPLTGETHVRTEVLALFAEAFVHSLRYQQQWTVTCSDDSLLSQKDTVFQLVFSIVLLNTDLHVMKESKRITKDQFTENLNYALHETGTGAKFTKEFLRKVYSSVRDDPLPSAEVTKLDTLRASTAKSDVSSIQSSNVFERSGSLRSSLRQKAVSVAQSIRSTLTEKRAPMSVAASGETSSDTVKDSDFNKDDLMPKFQALVWRKFDLGEDGVKLQPWKRSWKPACVMVLPKQNKLSLLLCVRGSANMHMNLHHAHVFQIDHKRRGIIIAVQFHSKQRLLLQCSLERERKKLYNTLLVNVARFSRRPLVGGVSGRGVFHPPLMQQGPADNISLDEQLADLKEYYNNVRGELDELKKCSIVGRKAQDQQYRLDKIAFLADEKRKYHRYLDHLEAFNDHCQTYRLKQEASSPKTKPTAAGDAEQPSLENARCEAASTCSMNTILEMSMCDRLSVHSSLYDKHGLGALSDGASNMSVHSACDAVLSTTDYQQHIGSPLSASQSIINPSRLTTPGVVSSVSSSQILKSPQLSLQETPSPWSVSAFDSRAGSERSKQRNASLDASALQSRSSTREELPPGTYLPSGQSITPQVVQRPASASRLVSPNTVVPHKHNPLVLNSGNNPIGQLRKTTTDVVRHNSGAGKTDFYQGSFRRRTASADPERVARSNSSIMSSPTNINSVSSSDKQHSVSSAMQDQIHHV